MKEKKTITSNPKSSASGHLLGSTKLHRSLSSSVSTPELNLCVAAAMVEKQAENVLILDLRELPQAQAHYFVLGSAQNERQLEAISTEIQKQSLYKYKEKPWFVEGRFSDHWILIDYVDVVAHIFMPEERSRYALEELWGDAQMISYHSR